MKRCQLVGLLLLATFSAASVGTAVPANQPTLESLQIDSVRSHAAFSLRAILLMNIRGEFSKVSGKVHLDRSANSGWVDAHIDANAVDMSNRDREDWVRSAEFFDSGQYPDIHFRSDPISHGLLREGGDLRGRLRLRGIEREVVLSVLPADCDQPGRDCPMHAQGSISRSEFGMRSKRAVLGDRVLLDLWVFVEPASP